MAANAREARRRKIMERGSDRLALITGRIETPKPSYDLLPPSQSQPLDVADTSSSSQTLISNEHAPRIHVSNPNTTVSPRSEEEESDSILLKHDAASDPYHPKACDSGSPTPTLSQCEGNNEISKTPTFEVEQVELPDSSLDASGTEQQSLQIQELKFFTPGEISSAITASASTRLCCSVAVALLVILSYLGFPLLGSQFMKILISFRPLYLVLVTSVTVVVARLFTGKRRGFARSVERQNETSLDGDQWAEHLGMALEAGLVVLNVMDAMFMDCAIYAIIVICGLSLVQI